MSAHRDAKVVSISPSTLSHRPYITCTIYYPEQSGKPEKKKTSAYRIHAHKKLLNQTQSPTTSPVWDPAERLEWTYDESDFAFLRILVKSDDAFAKNPAFLTSAVRLVSIPEGEWHSHSISHRQTLMHTLGQAGTLCECSVSMEVKRPLPCSFVSPRRHCRFVLW